MMYVPSALYRLQFNPSFTFSDAEKVIGYLSDLGVTDIYASPVFASRPGSTHGYDVVDPGKIDEELGGEKKLLRLIGSAEKKGVFWVQDIVPNHMAVDKSNGMLMDVLEKGPRSEYFGFFDIDWRKGSVNGLGQLLMPVLGGFYADELEDGRIKIIFSEKKLRVKYYDHLFPLNLTSFADIFEKVASGLDPKKDSVLSKKLQKSLAVFEDFSSGKASEKDLKTSQKRLWDLYREETGLKKALEKVLRKINGRKGAPHTFDELDEILQKQYFRLSFWKVAQEEINYRRFFSINDLISLRMEEKKVFEDTHKLILSLVLQGKIKGLRIDHIDGLKCPEEYLARLKKSAGSIWITVEKILKPGESLPRSWRTEGTTGYDFLGRVNEAFCDQSSESKLDTHYRRFIRLRWNYPELLAADKRLIIGKHLAGDIDNLAAQAKSISSMTRYGRDFTLYGLRRALVEIAAYFPVYRSYINGSRISSSDRKYVEKATRQASRKQPGLRHEIEFLKDLLLLRVDAPDKKSIREYKEFILRFQQYTGPLMAKGFEDTALYRYNRLISLNEVGGDPSSMGLSDTDLHKFNLKRSKRYPFAMNASSTHDTKRSEDVRARINVITEIAAEWRKHVFRWKSINSALKDKVGNVSVPDANDEYFLYQTLIGSYPFDPDKEHREYVDRIKSYVIKSVREAKRYTAWIEPDEAYEKAYLSFVDKILDRKKGNRFLKDFEPFQKNIAFFGMLNSLSQTLLKLTSPGVPDIYQGTELWDLSLVDPDNRRPVDYCLRRKYLKKLNMLEKRSSEELFGELYKDPSSGLIKLFLLNKALKFRLSERDLYKEGAYHPIKVRGEKSKNIIAFARVLNGRWAITVTGRSYTRLVNEAQMPLSEKVWGDTTLKLPENAPSEWVNVFTNEAVSGKRSIKVGDITKTFPYGLLKGESA